MTSAWEQFEELIRAEMRKVYSETAMEPRNVGATENADGFGKITGPCGDTMEIWLRVKNGTVAEATFLTDGCGTSIASGSMITELAKRTSISMAQKISRQNVLSALGGLPEESQHCAILAANTLKAAIRDYLAMEREPWKRGYRKH